MILKAIGRIARREGTKTVVHKVDPKDYRSFLRKAARADSPTARSNYLASQTQIGS
jgi:hypothetical protein